LSAERLTQPQLGTVTSNSAPQVLSARFGCQVGQRLLVPTHVFGDAAAASCDRQARPCWACGQR